VSKVKACFKALGFEFNDDKFEDRLKAQKIVYLLQLKGLKGLDFPFKPYLRGPYSPGLTRELYGLEGKDETLAQTDTKPLEEFKEIFQNLDAGELEAAATYALHAFTEQLSAVEATRKTREEKRSLTQTQLTLGINKAKEYLFEPTREELEEMKREFAPWQAASIQALRDWEARNG